MAKRETGELLDLRGIDTSNGHETEPGKEPVAILRMGLDGDTELSLPKTDRESVPLVIDDPCDRWGDA